jgi:ubiquinone/menaquinone biosynthesis C-methylase UbiE
MNEVELQRRYYTETAHAYDSMHEDDSPSHAVALAMLLAFVDLLGIRSILDVGSGTGRVLRHIKERRPDILVRGVEPVAALRAIGHSNGLSADELMDGDANALPFQDGQFDLVVEFSVLHHVPVPARMVAEMLRVADKAIFIHDSNNFGQGRPAVRLLKQALDRAGLWPLADWFKTRGRGYSVTEGDGVAYSYSVFSNLRQIRADCSTVHMMNTSPAGTSLYRSAENVALIGLKR